MPRVCDAESTRGAVDATVARVAARQYGAFTRAQARAGGATRSMIEHRLRVGRWSREALDVFRVAGVPSSWHQALMVACLAWGVGAVVSHRAAAALWRLAGFEPGSVELTVPTTRRRSAPGVAHRYRLSRSDTTRIEGVPVTTPARTLLDLAAVAPAELVEEAIDDALRRGLVTIPRLRRRFDAEARPGRRGIATMRSLLEARDPSMPVPASVFERRLLRLVRQARLPEPVRQHEIRDGDRLVGIPDFAFPEQHLAIEADGYRWHSGRVRWEHDRARRNELTLLGWRVIHITWTDLIRRPDATIDTIRAALADGA
ncbi:MAG: DUF559 domain-containing protein, partial [Actinomycetota bacterium]